MNAQVQNKTFRELVKEAALVAYGVELSDLYCDLVLSRRLTLRDAVRDFVSHDSEYLSGARVVH